MEYLKEIDWHTPEFGDLYDELPLWSAPFGLMLLDRMPMRSGMTILDVGAGTGFLSIELSQRCGSGASVIAVDPWDAAMRRLKRKLDQRGTQNVQTIVQDAAMLELPGSSVDLIVSNLGINNFENADAVLKTCFRVAKPGARLFLTTNLVGHMSEFYDVYRSVLVDLGLSSQVAKLDAHINHRATVDSVRRQLEQAGFEVVDVAMQSFRERFASGTALFQHYFIRLAFVPGWKSIVPDESTKDVFTTLENRLNDIALTHGELALTIPAACIQAKKRQE